MPTAMMAMHDGLSIGILATHSRPTRPTLTVLSSSLAADVACSQFHTIALSSSGDIWGCGSNGKGLNRTLTLALYRILTLNLTQGQLGTGTGGTSGVSPSSTVPKMEPIATLEA